MRKVALCLLVLSAILPLPAQTSLPAGLSMTLRLQTALDSEHTRVDDPVVAIVVKDAKVKGQVIIPARATVHGYVRLLDRQKNQVAVGLEFKELRSAGSSTRVSLRLVEVVSQLPGTREIEIGSLERKPQRIGSAGQVSILNEPAGVGTFVVPAARFRHPHLEMIWQALPPK